MSKRIQGIIVGMLATVLLFGGVAAAASRTESISATFRDIKIVIDGEEFIPRDINDNIVEPFIFNGTTFLPVRAVSQALDMDVKWDGDTGTVYIDSTSRNGGGSSGDSDVRSVAIRYEDRPMTDVTMTVGESLTVSVWFESEGIEDEIIWFSSDSSILEAVASNPEGTVATITAVGRGTATLTVTVGGVESECIVRVR